MLFCASARSDDPTSEQETFLFDLKRLSYTPIPTNHPSLLPLPTLETADIVQYTKGMIIKFYSSMLLQKKNMLITDLHETSNPYILQFTFK